MHLAALLVDVSHGFGKRSVFQAQILNLLLVILAVEELFFHETRAPLGQVRIEFRVSGLTDGLRHLGHGAERAQVDAGAHAVRAPEPDVVGIVVRLKQPPLVIRIPGADAVVQAALHQRIHSLEPIGIS